MRSFEINTEQCSRTAEIGAYLDGELSPDEELSLEAHFAGCKTCTAELNLHKLFLNELEQALDDGPGIELPENFTKVIVTAAESNVGGLRRRRELVAALSICAVTLLLIFLLALAGGGAGVLGGGVIADKLIALAAAAGHVVYSFALGIAVIIRSISSGAGAAAVPTAAIVTVVAAVAAWMMYSRLRRPDQS